MKLIKKIILFIIIAILLFFTIIGLQGYNLYNSAIGQISLSEKVYEIQNDENFVSISELPDDLINATIAVEDHRFKNHGAIDIISIGRAIFSNIKAKEAVEGGSTITQQVAKNLYFITENEDISRKVAELILSYHLEKNYSKDEIFELYVNTIYYGNGYYGIKEASNGYLKKEPKELTLDESTMLAGIPNAPSAYAPTVNMDLCKNRQAKVIRSMVKYGYITQEEADGIKLGM
ncbi:MAG: transglycosylase domain-containing protein [Clostridia bacterium]|nr:transglycosylase domain-containing protein [Clostridia bacterium]